MLVRFIFILFLIIAYKFIPVFEPRGVNYILSIFLLGIIVFETYKLWKTIKIDEVKKQKIQKIGYLTFIITIFIVLILGIHKEDPASNIRFIRLVFIVTFIIMGGEIVKEISNASIPNIIKNACLVLYSSITFIAIIEACFMFIALSHGSGEAYSGKIWGNRNWNPINSYGFRDEEPKNKKSNVFFIGDSFTAGWGVKKIEDRFGEITSNEITKKGKSINEINLGRYGADTQLEYYIFENFTKKSAIKPDHIVLQFFVNDMDKFIPYNKKCSTLPVNEGRLKKILVEGSYLINFINSIYPSQNSNAEKPKECDYLEQLKYVYQTDSIWKKEEKQLNKFRDYCSENNIKMTIVFFPFMEDLELSKKIKIDEKLKKYCNSNNISFFNVTDVISNIPKKNREASLVDAHASKEVHKIVGKKLATLIKI